MMLMLLYIEQKNEKMSLLIALTPWNNQDPVTSSQAEWI